MGSLIKIDFKIRRNSKPKISVTNEINKLYGITELEGHFNKIIGSENPDTLYEERLKYLSEESLNEKVQLGLFRILYESDFKLNYKIENNLLSIIAE